MMAGLTFGNSFSHLQFVLAQLSHRAQVRRARARLFAQLLPAAQLAAAGLLQPRVLYLKAPAL